MVSSLRRYIPRPVWNVLRKSKNIGPDLLDAVDSLTGRRDPLVPPHRMFRLIGHGNFKKTGEEFFGYFTRFGLKPEHNVLDIGCGVGRMAIPLTRFLKGNYEGFDIVPYEVEWCSRSITPRFPNFHFRVADIFNEGYNPRGKIAGKDYRFPYPDGSFEFCYLTSVFTHMLPDELNNYLREIRRVLKPSGRCLATCFLLNEESEALIAKGKSKLNFAYTNGRCKVVNPEVPTDAVGYPEGDMEAMLKEAGLALLSKHYGSWCVRKEILSYQDILVLEKPAS